MPADWILYDGRKRALPRNSVRLMAAGFNCDADTRQLRDTDTEQFRQQQGFASYKYTRNILEMDKDKLREYLNTRRQGWPYEGIYHIDRMGEHRFVARIGDELAGLSYAEITEPGSEARMRMNLKSSFAEFGIGTELLETLMEDLRDSGFNVIRYQISREHYAFQIYRNLGFEVESQDMDEVRFVWRRGNSS